MTEDIIRGLAAARGYTIKAGKVYDARGEEVFFFQTALFDQEYLNRMNLDVYSIVLCDKIKKLRVPQEMLQNIELHLTCNLRRALLPNKFKPRHEKLEGDELAVMSKHADNLPLLLKSDPICVIHGFKPGDIIKIYRLNGTLFFRRVE